MDHSMGAAECRNWRSGSSARELAARVSGNSVRPRKSRWCPRSDTSGREARGCCSGRGAARAPDHWQKVTANALERPVPDADWPSRNQNWYQRVVPTIAAVTGIEYAAVPCAENCRAGKRSTGGATHNVPPWKGALFGPVRLKNRSPLTFGTAFETVTTKFWAETLGVPVQPMLGNVPIE